MQLFMLGIFLRSFRQQFFLMFRIALTEPYFDKFGLYDRNKIRQLGLLNHLFAA